VFHQFWPRLFENEENPKSGMLISTLTCVTTQMSNLMGRHLFFLSSYKNYQFSVPIDDVIGFVYLFSKEFGGRGWEAGRIAGKICIFSLKTC